MLLINKLTSEGIEFGGEMYYLNSGNGVETL